MARGDESKDISEIIKIEDRQEFEKELYKLPLNSDERVKVMMMRSDYLYDKYRPVIVNRRTFKELWRNLYDD